MVANALMIDPHTGQPIDWTAAQGPSTTFSGIDPKMLALYQQAGLWKPEYSAAVTDWGSDPASRAQARQQWMNSPEYQALSNSLNGWTQGQARKDYGVYDLLQSPDGTVYSAGSMNKGPSFHKDDYANMASVLLGGYGAAVGGATGVGSSLYGLSGTQAAIAGGATLGAANGAVQAYGNDQNVWQGAVKGGVMGGVGGYASAGMGGADASTTSSDPYVMSSADRAAVFGGDAYGPNGGGSIPYDLSTDIQPLPSSFDGFQNTSAVPEYTGDGVRQNMYSNEGYGSTKTYDLTQQQPGMTQQTDLTMTGTVGDNTLPSVAQVPDTTANTSNYLARFFSGDGNWNDYLRAGQAAYGMYAQNRATDAATAGNQAQMDLMREMWQANQAENKPLVDMRNSVLPQISNLLQNPNSITQDPGYQFQLKQGQNQLDNRAAASGNYYSGAQQRASQRYGQDYAGTKLDQSLNRLMGVANGTQIGSTNNQNANQQFAVGGGNALATGGNIRAGGYLGQYNTVNNNLNDWMQDQTNRKYWGGGG